MICQCIERPHLSQLLPADPIAKVDVVIGADGANSRVAKDIEAGDYEYAIAFQDWKGPPDSMTTWPKG